MALVDNAWYVNFGNGSTTGYWSLTKWAANTAYVAGVIRRPTGQSVGVTMTSANPGVVTWRDNAGTALTHNFAVGDTVVFTTTGALPSAVASGTTYYVIAAGLTASAFQISATPAGTAVNMTSGTQSGVHTGTATHVGNERAFVCTTAGTSAAVLEPVWTLTRGALVTDGTAVWQGCTGIAALNGDASNTPTWTITATPPGGVKGTAVTLGQVIKRDNGVSYQICTVAGTAGSGAEPAFSDTAGTTTVDNTATWTSLGPVGGFTAFAAPHARIVNALTATWAQAGNKVYVGDNHAETQAMAHTIAGAGTSANPIKVYCVDRTVVPPSGASLLKTATVTTVGANALTISSIAYFYGFTFNVGTSTSTAILTASSVYLTLESCVLAKPATGANSAAFTLAGGIRLKNVSFSLGNVGDAVKIGGRLVWDTDEATVPFLGSIYSNIGTINLVSAGNSIIRGINFSGLDASTVMTSSGGISVGDVTFINCKFPTGATLLAQAAPSYRVDLIASDSGTAGYRQERYHQLGTMVAETTIVRTNGASDGVTPISWKITTTASSRWVNPFECFPIAIWNNVTTGNVTVTVFGIWGGGAVPNNDDIWIEVQYIGATPPLATLKRATKANDLAAGSAHSTDVSPWGGSTTAFSMATTFAAPGARGLIYVTVKAAKESTIFYVDPKIALS